MFDGEEDWWKECCIRWEMPRYLKEPDGWKFSSLRKILQPAIFERAGDSMSGVRT